MECLSPEETYLITYIPSAVTNLKGGVARGSNIRSIQKLLMYRAYDLSFK